MRAFNIQDLARLTDLEIKVITDCLLRNIDQRQQQNDANGSNAGRWLAINRLNKEKNLRSLTLAGMSRPTSEDYQSRVRQTLFGSDRSVAVDLNAVPRRIILSDSDAQDGGAASDVVI